MSFTGILILLFSIFSGLAFLLLICACALNACKPTPRPQLADSATDISDAEPETTSEPVARDYPPPLVGVPVALAKSVSSEPNREPVMTGGRNWR